jgi:DNA-binding NarL/FixJ family response regulator
MLRRMEDRLRLVIADDEYLLRKSMASLLELQGFDVVGEAGDADDLLRKVGAHKPDVCLVDVAMPPTHTNEGLDAAREIRARHPEIAILVLSQYIRAEAALELVADGSDGIGYLLKQQVSSVEDFAQAVRRVAAGGSAIDPRVVSTLVARTREHDPIADLTPRQREVLALIAQGLSNRAIAEELVVEPYTVQKHINGIFRELSLPPDDERESRRVKAVLMYLQSG